MLKDYLQLPRQVHILCLGTLVNRAGAFVLAFLTIYLNEEMHFGIVFGTQCFAIFGAGSLVASIVGGHFADHWGRRPVMILALFGGAAMLCLLSFATQKWHFVVGIAAFALLNEMYRPAASAMIGDVCTSLQRPKGYALMYVAINLGMGIGPFLGGVIAEKSFAWLFWGDGLTTGAYAVIILLFIKESAPHKLIPLATPTADDGSAVAVDYATEKKSASLLEVFQDYPFILFCLAGFFVACDFALLFSIFPPYLRSLDISKPVIGLLISLNGIMIFACQLPLTQLLSRFERMGVITIGALLIGVGLGINIWATTATVLAFGVVVWTIGEMLNTPFAFAAVTDFAPKVLRARYHGVYSTTFSLSLVFGSLVGGWVLDAYGGKKLWTAAAMTGVIAAVFYLSVYRSLSTRVPIGE